jgi:hypothetical protein
LATLSKAARKSRSPGAVNTGFVPTISSASTEPAFMSATSWAIDAAPSTGDPTTGAP